MLLNLESLKNTKAWEDLGVKVPNYDIAAMAERTKKDPIWIHFGSGNTYRGFISSLQHDLLKQGLTDKGIIAAETFDGEIIDRIFKPYDNLSLQVTLEGSGNMDSEIIASTAEALRADTQRARLEEIFCKSCLQIVSFTITEKGYFLRGTDGKLISQVEEDMKNGPEKARQVMAVIAALLFKRYKAGKLPITVSCLDNYPKNGERLQGSLLEISRAWKEGGFVDSGFIDYLLDEKQVSFPWSMIDKITPRPDDSVYKFLDDKGIGDMKPILTANNTYIAVFVNTERPQYLVIEDKFPNGRPPLEKAGVYMTDRDTVNKTEQMKVATCLNPLHTAMAIYGMLFGYTKIADEMKDREIVELIKRLGLVEGLPVVTDPKIISPKAFLDEVLNERLPNPFMPDAPMRIVSDTSLKVGMRFGETIKNYIKNKMPLSDLVSIPLAIAGWMRYLLGINDNGEALEISYDPLKEELQEKLKGIVWNKKESYTGQLKNILCNESIFGLDLCKTELAPRIEEYFISMLEGPGAVRSLLQKKLP